MSFFESLIEGGANAAANSIGNYQKRQQMLDDEERGNANALEKYKQQIQIQQDMAEQARQAKQERLQTQTAQAEESGAKLSRAQALASLNKEYGSNHTEADVLPEELDAYGPDTVGKIDNNLKAARSAGLYDAADSFSAERSATVKAMQDAFKERIAERKIANDEARIDNQSKRGDQQHNEAMARIAASERRAGSSAKQETLDKLTTRKNAAIRAMAAYQNQGMDASDPVFRSEVEELAEVNRLLASQNEKRDPKPAAPADKPASAKPQSTKDLVPTKGWKLLGVK